MKVDMVSVSFSKRKKTSLKIIILDLGKISLKIEHTHWKCYKKKHKRNFLCLESKLESFLIECETDFSVSEHVLEENENRKRKRNSIPTKEKHCKRIDLLDKFV
jgi:hypothetical protein